MSEEDRANIRETRSKALKTWLEAAPGALTPEQQLDFIDDGTLPSELENGDLPELDETDPEVDAQFQRATAPGDD
jgi:hypothetical protein